MEKPGRLVHVESMRMRWGDMDVLGHMNNTVYFRYFEQARISWFDGMQADYRTDQEGAVLGAIHCRFRIPVVYPADLSITLRLGEVRRSSFLLYSEMIDAKDSQRLYATAEATMVWVDLRDGKSRPAPDWLRAPPQD